MKLSQLYSNDSRFNDVKFNPNFNVILGEIEDINDLSKDSHNLGKSTLIYLIDFMLLKKIDKTFFLKKVKQFSKHVFYLEIELNSGKYVTIRRGVEHNTKISIKFHDVRGLDCRKCTDWDYENLALTATDDSVNPISILQRVLGFDVLLDYKYRNTVSYFLRTQEDYSDVFKLHKYKGNDLDWKPVLFELLGFTSNYMIKKYQLDSEIDLKRKIVTKLHNDLNIDAGEIDKINGLIELKEEEKKQIVLWLDKFDFYKKEAGISKEAVDKIESKIAEYNTMRYNLDYEIQQINESMQEKVEYNLEDVIKIYQEVKIVFPTQLKKSYEELLDFNSRMSIERQKYLDKTLHEKEQKRQNVNKKLQELNDKRRDMLGELKNTDTFNKYNSYRSDLIKVERELERYKIELENISNVNNINKEIEELKEQLVKEKNSLSKQVSMGTKLYKDIRKDFHEYIKYILDQDAMLSIKINSNGNADFCAEFLNDDKEETAQNMGHTYRKILCACFDLAVVKNYSNHSFYRVIYHDGCMESLDPRKKKKYLELVQKVSKENDIQYILTSLRSDWPEEKEYEISKYEIAVTLNDSADNSGRLYGFVY